MKGEEKNTIRRISTGTSGKLSTGSRMVQDDQNY